MDNRINEKDYKNKPEFVKDMFDSLSDRYDLTNDVMTFGLAHHWRQTLVKESGAKPKHKVLDCATGTGDLAFAFQKAVGPEGLVVGCDFSQAMLEKAKRKSKYKNTNIRFEEQDVMTLSYEDNTFDITSIAYGIRNVQCPVKALKEMARVTRPGGYVMILETGELEKKFFEPILRWYFKLIPFIGSLTSVNKKAYKYLQDSSLNFPAREKFLETMKETNQFEFLDYKTLFNGGSYIYKGKVSDKTLS